MRHVYFNRTNSRIEKVLGMAAALGAGALIARIVELKNKYFVVRVVHYSTLIARIVELKIPKILKGAMAEVSLIARIVELKNT